MKGFEGDAPERRKSWGDEGSEQSRCYVNHVSRNGDFRIQSCLGGGGLLRRILYQLYQRHSAPGSQHTHRYPPSALLSPPCFLY